MPLCADFWHLVNDDLGENLKTENEDDEAGNNKPHNKSP